MALDDLILMFHSSNIGTITQWSFYDKPEVDKLLDAARYDLDSKKRTDALKKAQEIAGQGACPVVPIGECHGDFRLQEDPGGGRELHQTPLVSRPGKCLPRPGAVQAVMTQAARLADSTEVDRIDGFVKSAPSRQDWRARTEERGAPTGRAAADAMLKRNRSRTDFFEAVNGRPFVLLKYILRRLLVLIPVLFLVTILISSLIYFSPGDPVRVMLGMRANEEAVADNPRRTGPGQALLPAVSQLARQCRPGEPWAALSRETRRSWTSSPSGCPPPWK